MTIPILFEAICVDDHQWFKSQLSEKYQSVTFRPYLYHHPLSTSVYTFQTSSVAISIRRNEDSYNYLLRPARGAHRNITPTRASFESELATSIEELNGKHYRSQFRGLKRDGDTLPKKTETALYEKFKTLYNLFSASKRDLCTVTGIGDKRAESILNPTSDPAGMRPEWCYFTVCPRCDEQFWSLSPINHRNSTLPEKPCIETIARLTYCPCCQFKDFTPAYIMNARPFTNETMNQYTSDVLSSHRFS